MSKFITVATANTYLANALHDNGLQALAHADVLLLQEVIGIEPNELKRMLRKAEYTEVFYDASFGLIIAIKDTGLTYIPNSYRTLKIGNLNLLEKILVKRWTMLPHEFTQRGFISVKLKIVGGDVLNIVNAHPSIDSPSFYRARQIKRLSRALNKEHYSGKLILGGDMNYRPGPHKVDRALAQQLGLSHVNLSGMHTWKVLGSQLEHFVRYTIFFSRKPIESYNYEMDALLYTGGTLEEVETRVVDIPSDHNAIVSTFKIS